jgi:hypothetical protein
MIDLSEVESAALPEMVRLLPDYESLLGPRYVSLLHGGRKLELEGALNMATMERSQVLNAIFRR